MTRNSIKVNAMTNLIAMTGLMIFIVLGITVNSLPVIYAMSNWLSNGSIEAIIINTISYVALTLILVLGSLRRVFLLSKYTAQLIVKDKPIYSGDAKVYLKIITL